MSPANRNAAVTTDIMRQGSLEFIFCFFYVTARNAAHINAQSTTAANSRS